MSCPCGRPSVKDPIVSKNFDKSLIGVDFRHRDVNCIWRPTYNGPVRLRLWRRQER